jgi:hypothetical protein
VASFAVVDGVVLDPSALREGERLFGTRYPEPAGHARDFSLAVVSYLSSRPKELRPPTSAL